MGGEDAKIIFFKDGIDERMNGTCAGGTGAFIDQMAILLNISVKELDALSLKAKKIYSIASRCGVFAKTDIQALLNQGATKEDVAASIFQSVVNQTISGLSQGRRIEGKTLFLGGPLFFCEGLQIRFAETLKISREEAIFPNNALFFVALGASMYAKNGKSTNFDGLIQSLSKSINQSETKVRLSPLFLEQEDYAEFLHRHNKDAISADDISCYTGDAWLGIDCGSTTTKLVLINKNKDVLYSFYSPNMGNPVELVREQIEKIRLLTKEKIKICGTVTTGYGEELIKNAFNADEGLVETMAHYIAAKHFMPDVDFILDSGGQDIKCFKINNGEIDSIMLNEACSSGCGSFIETFARSLNYPVTKFAKEGLFSKAPVDLGTRCTVFMNSGVKQSQKEGATLADISAGLSISVVKNAIYKVIRATSAKELGKNIVVQGGTFLNDAVLRAFEKELDINVVRPNLSGLMGAYGAAIYAMKYKNSKLIDKTMLKNFLHTSTSTYCSGCTNNCQLTVNSFGKERKYISGNRCEKGLDNRVQKELPNLFEYKRKLLSSFKPLQSTKGKIGIPLTLSMYELFPLFYTIFSFLGYQVEVSGQTDRKTFEKGQYSIPSDTACFPAELMHGHIEKLIEQKCDTIFYPCITYNIKEENTDNHYNCPLVAYYSETLKSNIDELKNVRFLYPYLNINSQSLLIKSIYPTLKQIDSSIDINLVKEAVKRGFKAYDNFREAIKKEGERAIDYARKNNKRIMVLAGRPYHIDPEVNHGIDNLANSLDFVVVSEDSVAHLVKESNVNVLNQWTYHARLYKSAYFAAQNSDVQLVQLISFGCGIDAITSDEIHSILKNKNKFYTQIKIDEISNLGAAKIRLRSLAAALDAFEAQNSKQITGSIN